MKNESCLLPSLQTFFLIHIFLFCNDKFDLESSPAGRSFSPHGRIYHNGLKKGDFQQKSQQILFDSTSATGIRLTCLLLIISFIFVVCTLPISIRALISDLFPEKKSTIRWRIIQLILTTLMYFNHTVNIFIFFFLYNSIFFRLILYFIV